MRDRTKYQVVFLGLEDDVYAKDATERLASLLGMGPEVFDEALARAPVIIKADVDRSTAIDYLTAITQTGGRARFEPVPSNLEGLTCPKCGYARRGDEPTAEYECPSCGVIYEKHERSLRKSAGDSSEPSPATERLREQRALKASRKRTQAAFQLTAVFFVVFVFVLVVFVLLSSFGEDGR